jgi:hypothetical protein
MKDVKFRGWNGKGMVHNLIVSYDGSSAMWLDAGIEENGADDWAFSGLMQFVGLVDKDGTNIYAGDVLKLLGYFGTVTSNRSCFGITDIGSQSFTPFFELVGNELEVVGNIYENPGMMLRRRKDDV